MAIKTAMLTFKFKLGSLRAFPEQDPMGSKRIALNTSHCAASTFRAATLVYDSLLTMSKDFKEFKHIVHPVTLYKHTVIYGCRRRTKDGKSPARSFCSATVNVYEVFEGFAVSVILEEVPNADMETDPTSEFGFTYDDLSCLAQAIDQRFLLKGLIEIVPVLNRGRFETQNFLRSRDGRVLEYDFDSLIYQKRSAFSNIRIVNSPSLGRTLLLDQMHGMSESDTKHFKTLIDTRDVNYAGLDVLVLGGGDGGALYELLQLEPKSVTVIEIDQEVMNACRSCIRPQGETLKPNYSDKVKFIVGDCIEVLPNLRAQDCKYDIVINDLMDTPHLTVDLPPLPPHRKRGLRRPPPTLKWNITEALLNMVFEVLRVDGTYMTRVASEGYEVEADWYEYLMRTVKGSLHRTFRTCFVNSTMEFQRYFAIRSGQWGSVKRHDPDSDSDSE